MSGPTFTWQLGSAPAVSIGASTFTAPPAPVTVVPRYLRRGIVLPFRRDEKRDYATQTGPALYVSIVTQILGTKASTDYSPGEVSWRDNFGSTLHELRHRKLDQILLELCRLRIQEALRTWAPRIRLTRVSVSELGRTLWIRILFDVTDPSGGIVFGDLESIVPLDRAA